MKKTGRILFSMAAAGVAISAAAFTVKKYNDRCGKSALGMEPDDGFWEEYFPNQEESVSSGSDEFDSPDGDTEENPAAQGIYLTADEAGFLRYILEGIDMNTRRSRRKPCFRCWSSVWHRLRRSLRRQSPKRALPFLSGQKQDRRACDGYSCIKHRG